MLIPLTSKNLLPNKLENAYFSPSKNVQCLNVKSINQDANLHEFNANIFNKSNKMYNFKLGQKFAYIWVILLFLFNFSNAHVVISEHSVSLPQIKTLAYDCNNMSMYSSVTSKNIAILSLIV